MLREGFKGSEVGKKKEKERKKRKKEEKRSRDVTEL